MAFVWTWRGKQVNLIWILLLYYWRDALILGQKGSVNPRKQRRKIYINSDERRLISEPARTAAVGKDKHVIFGLKANSSQGRHFECFAPRNRRVRRFIKTTITMPPQTNALAMMLFLMMLLGSTQSGSSFKNITNQGKAYRIICQRIETVTLHTSLQ